MYYTRVLGMIGVLMLAAGGVGCLPYGVPRAACWNMNPEEIAPGMGHLSIPQAGKAPFTLTYSEREPGIYTITLSGTEDFKGFFIQARDAEGKTLGTFTEYDSSTSATVDCGDLGGNEEALSHNNNSPKRRVTATWENHSPTEPDVLLATVVVDINTFWVKLEGRETRLRRRSRR